MNQQQQPEASAASLALSAGSSWGAQREAPLVDAGALDDSNDDHVVHEERRQLGEVDARPRCHASEREEGFIRALTTKHSLVRRTTAAHKQRRIRACPRQRASSVPQGSAAESSIMLLLQQHINTAVPRPKRRRDLSAQRPDNEYPLPTLAPFGERRSARLLGS